LEAIDKEEELNGDIPDSLFAQVSYNKTCLESVDSVAKMVYYGERLTENFAFLKMALFTDAQLIPCHNANR